MKTASLIAAALCAYASASAVATQEVCNSRPPAVVDYVVNLPSVFPEAADVLTNNGTSDQKGMLF